MHEPVEASGRGQSASRHPLCVGGALRQFSESASKCRLDQGPLGRAFGLPAVHGALVHAYPGAESSLAFFCRDASALDVFGGDHALSMHIAL